MEITGSSPQQVDIELRFLKPWKAVNQVTFLLEPSGEGTHVTWRMRGTNKGLQSVFAKVVSMDRLVGKDFEKGLARLRSAAEVPA